MLNAVLDETLAALAKSELQGICAAFAQQAARIAAHAALARWRPQRAARAVRQLTVDVGLKRSRLMADFVVSKAHAVSTLEAFKRQGVTSVGTLAEMIPAIGITDAARKTPQHRHPHSGKFITKHEATREWGRQTTGRFGKAPPAWRRRSKAAKERLAEVEGKVSILNAGDDKVCPTCLRISEAGPYPIDEAMDLIPVHPNCLPGDCLVSSSSRITAVSERRYDGDLIIIRTAENRELSCTPNHPVLTQSGWVAAHLLNIGHDVVCDGSRQWIFGLDNHDEQMPSRIEDIARAFSETRGVVSVEMPTASPDFHGDGVDGDIAIIWADRSLLLRLKPALLKHFDKRSLIPGDHSAFGLRSIQQFLFRGFSATDSVMRGIGLALAGIAPHLAPFERFRFALASRGNAIFNQYSSQYNPLNVESFRDGIFTHPRKIVGNHSRRLTAEDLALGFIGGSEHPLNRISSNSILAHEIRNGKAGPVFIDKTVFIDRRHFTGQVYNLQTDSGAYSAGGIITHNCRCVYVPAGFGSEE